MSRIQLFILTSIFFVNCVFPGGQQHRAGTNGPETPGRERRLLAIRFIFQRERH